MKDLKEYLNESLEPTTIAAMILGVSSVLSSITVMLTSLRNEQSYPGEYNPIKRIQSWFADRKTKKIIDRLSDDEDIKAFLSQPNYKQQNGWRELLKSKLSEDELKYIARITKTKFVQ